MGVFSALRPQELLVDFAIASILVYLVYVAIEDYAKFKITNRTVFVGLLLYGLWAAVGGTETILFDLGAGLLLFAIGFAFWSFRVVGAGDAKFMLVCGALVGVTYLPAFAIGLLVVSIVMFLAIKIASRPTVYPLVVMSRLGTIVDNGRVPYGVALSAATIYGFVTRALTTL